MTTKKTTVGVGGDGEASKPATTRRVRVDQETIDVMLKQAERLPRLAGLSLNFPSPSKIELLPEELSDEEDEVLDQEEDEGN